MKATSKMKTTSKMKMTSKKKTISKMKTTLKTKMKLDLWKFTTRPRLRKSGCWFFERDETETRLSHFFMSETRLNLIWNSSKTGMRPRVLMYVFMRPGRESTFNEEKDCTFGIIFKNYSSRSGRTETRLIKIEAKETRLSQNFFIRDKTETRQVPKFCTRPLVLRPRWNQDSCPALLCRGGGDFFQRKHVPYIGLILAWAINK